jgi:hypothetical protein
MTPQIRVNISTRALMVNLLAVLLDALLTHFSISMSYLQSPGQPYRRSTAQLSGKRHPQTAGYFLLKLVIKT